MVCGNWLNCKNICTANTNTLPLKVVSRSGFYCACWWLPSFYVFRSIGSLLAHSRGEKKQRKKKQSTPLVNSLISPRIDSDAFVTATADWIAKKRTLRRLKQREFNLKLWMTILICLLFFDRTKWRLRIKCDETRTVSTLCFCFFSVCWSFLLYQF